MSRSDHQRQGTGKYHGVVGLPSITSVLAKGNVREWCYLCARRGLDPYHGWEAHQALEKAKTMTSDV